MLAIIYRLNINFQIKDNSMGGSHCRLYDENLVRNIMISTGVSIIEYVKENKNINKEDICEFIEFNAYDIISETIKSLSDNYSKDEEFDKNGSCEEDSDDDDDDDSTPW